MFDTLIIAALCAQLASPSWHTRELAHKSLQARPDAVPYLRACQGCKSPEIAGRATQILSGHYRANAERLTAGITYWPWIDQLPWDHPERESVFHQYLVKAQQSDPNVGYGGHPNWPGYRLATRFMVHDLFRAGHSPEAVQAILDGMWAKERQWMERNWQRHWGAVATTVRWVR